MTDFEIAPGVIVKFSDDLPLACGTCGWIFTPDDRTFSIEIDNETLVVLAATCADCKGTP